MLGSVRGRVTFFNSSGIGLLLLHNNLEILKVVGEILDFFLVELLSGLEFLETNQ